jgi:hypothetical protein
VKRPHAGKALAELFDGNQRGHGAKPMASERRTPASTRKAGRESAGRPGFIRLKSQREARHIAGPPNRCATILRRAAGVAQAQAFPSVCSAYVGGDLCTVWDWGVGRTIAYAGCGPDDPAR